MVIKLGAAKTASPNTSDTHEIGPHMKWLVSIILIGWIRAFTEQT